MHSAVISRFMHLNKPIAIVFKNKMQEGTNMVHMP
jgi:hypothetical protein